MFILMKELSFNRSELMEMEHCEVLMWLRKRNKFIKLEEQAIKKAQKNNGR